MPGGKRTQNRDLAAVALAAGRTVADAAAAANVSERTLYEWLATDPALKVRVGELRGRMIDSAAGRLADSMAAAADAMRGLLDSSTEGIKLRAADLLLSHAVKLAEILDLQVRVEELEQRLGEKKP